MNELVQDPFLEPAWVVDYVGVPFVDKGFTFAGCHCWGLVWLVYKNQVKLELPTYGAVAAADLIATARTIAQARALPPWIKLAWREPGEDGAAFLRRVRSVPFRAFDVVVMQSRHDPERHRMIDGHVGVMVTNKSLIHVERECATVKLRLTDPSVRNTISGIYRHEQLA